LLTSLIESFKHRCGHYHYLSVCHFLLQESQRVI